MGDVFREDYADKLHREIIGLFHQYSAVAYRVDAVAVGAVCFIAHCVTFHMEDHKCALGSLRSGAHGMADIDLAYTVNFNRTEAVGMPVDISRNASVPQQ